ncbi:helix-turn-helix domain-containing protein [Corynebacterium guaraldiae]|uniref:helix-turn-helix domain-containing protein n=1 Tax=Corynebacterium guaraldiae TaxID=3051103 RepID=UPI0012B91E75|nr:helix-turn-helix domain-containing protein [Corynebacterium guaraldiae]MTD98610.1 helix-turn-helix domain-containing protein [Corynebacterium guaraldiae]
MTPSTPINDRLMIEETTLEELKSLQSLETASIRVVDEDGRSVPLSRNVQRLISQILASVAQRGEVTISRVPEELTSTVAAELLGVSRPTLMKWAKGGKIVTHKRGTHTRFKREDVLQLKRQRAEERMKAFQEWRAFEEENAHLF